MSALVEQSYEVVPTSSLTLHPENYNSGDVDAIHASIDRTGFYGAIIVQKSTRHICAGNHRYLAAQRAGLLEIPVIVVDVDDDEARAILAADNGTARLASVRDEKLAALLEKLAATPQGLAGTGYTDDDFAKLTARLAGQGADGDKPEPPVELPYSPKTKPGDVWHLGAHRVICGDVRDPQTVATLMAGDLADLVFTSPPYNVDVDYGSHDDGPRPWPEYRDFLTACLDPVLAYLAPGRALCWNLGVNPRTYPHRQAVMLEDLGLEYVRQLVWKKVGVPVPSWFHTDRERVARMFSPNMTHEVVLLYVTPGGEPVSAGPPDPDQAAAMFNRRTFDPEPAHELVVVFANAKQLEKGRKVTFPNTLEHDVFELNQAASTVDIPTASASGRTGPKGVNLDRRSRKAHPAPFPVELPAAFIRHLADVGTVVLDPFVGSGSTIIAAAKTGRIGRGIDNDPAYVDVACYRYQRLTGDLPVNDETGQAVNFLAANR